MCKLRQVSAQCPAALLTALLWLLILKISKWERKKKKKNTEMKYAQGNDTWKLQVTFQPGRRLAVSAGEFEVCGNPKDMKGREKRKSGLCTGRASQCHRQHGGELR